MAGSPPAAEAVLPIRIPIAPPLLPPTLPGLTVTVTAPRKPRTRRGLPRALAYSVLAHLAIVALFMLTLQFAAKGEPAPRRVIQGVMIVRSTANTAQAMPAPAPPVAAPAAPDMPPPAPPRRTRETAETAILPKPSPPVPAAVPQAGAKPAPEPATREAAASPAPAPTGSQGESSLTLLLNQVRENWLQPAGSRRLFRCRLRIDFRAGGIIANVSVLQGCGDSPLDDSVIRAVWKTQPLPVDLARAQDGSVVLEFTP